MGVASFSYPRRSPVGAACLVLTTLLLVGCGRGSSSTPSAQTPAPAQTQSQAATTATLPGVPQDWRLPPERFAAVNGGNEALAVPGQVTLINFWATWCGPCLKEIPDLDRLYRAVHEHGVRIVGVAVDSGSAKNIRTFAERHAMHYPLLMAGSHALDSRFGLIGLPVTVVVDADGVVRRRLLGPQTLAQFQAVIAAYATANPNTQESVHD